MPATASAALASIHVRGAPDNSGTLHSDVNLYMHVIVLRPAGVAVGAGYDASAAARAAVASASAMDGPQLITCDTCSVRHLALSM